MTEKGGFYFLPLHNLLFQEMLLDTKQTGLHYAVSAHLQSLTQISLLCLPVNSIKCLVGVMMTQVDIIASYSVHALLPAFVILEYVHLLHCRHHLCSYLIDATTGWIWCSAITRLGVIYKLPRTHWRSTYLIERVESSINTMSSLWGQNIWAATLETC